jgi:hypothetical protein
VRGATRQCEDRRAKLKDERSDISLRDTFSAEQKLQLCRPRVGSSQCGNASINHRILIFASFPPPTYPSTLSPSISISITQLLNLLSCFHTLSTSTNSHLASPPRSRVWVGSDTTGPVEFRTFSVKLTFSTTSTSITITMRATFALRNAARTPLIRFLGKRSVPRTSSPALPVQQHVKLTPSHRVRGPHSSRSPRLSHRNSP